MIDNAGRYNFFIEVNCISGLKIKIRDLSARAVRLWCYGIGNNNARFFLISRNGCATVLINQRFFLVSAFANLKIFCRLYLLFILNGQYPFQKKITLLSIAFEQGIRMVQ
jgi:hypothetical protein